LENRLRSILVTIGFALVQGQLGFLIILKTRGPILFLLLFITSIQVSIFLDGFEHALISWLSSLLLALISIFVFISIPMFLGVFPMDMVFIVIGSNVSRVLVTVLFIFAPIGFIGFFLGQVLRDNISRK